MEVIYACCCGLDVHAKTVVACLYIRGQKQVRTFTTMTDGLLQLSDWLTAAGCTHVAIESTGVYWRPVFNILEGNLEVILVNAQHIKAVPGRKTDVRDCEWICDLLRHGLLKASFIPPLHIRELRELTRHRQTLVRDLSAVANRIQKLIESANIKLGQVASDVLGYSGRLMLNALADGEADAEKMAQFAQGRLKAKTAQLEQALTGRLTPTQRFLLKELLRQYDHLQGAVENTNVEIQRQLTDCQDPFMQEAVTLLQTIPGVGERVAETIISEIGTEMSRFPTAAHLASWAGICPGNHQSAGKPLSGQTKKGNVYVRGALTQAAWAATRTKNTYLASQFRRLTTRLGKKRALVAVGHSILVIAYHLLSKRAAYEELGGDYFDRQNARQYQNKLVHKLEALGLKVMLEPATTLSEAPL
ncbi:MAG: IS110 family transposase [Blastocatellia bacterium]